MSLENDLMAALKTKCPRVHIGTAPYNTVQPYVTWQHIGGDSRRYLSNAAADTRNALIQVNVWNDSNLKAHALILQIEEALCQSLAFQAEPHGQPIGAYDDGDTAKGYLQTYSVTGAR